MIGSVLPALSDTHYVNINSTTPVSPYTNWNTAATVIQDAVDAASVRDTVLVADGKYESGQRLTPGGNLRNRLIVTNDILVHSAGGPVGALIIGRGPVGTNGVRCAYLSGGAVLSGFTLTNGFTGSSWYPLQDGSGGGAFVTNASVTNCLLRGNAAAYQGGGVFGGKLYACDARGNAAYDGGGVAGSQLWDCTIITNSATNGGGAYAATLSGCLLSCNVGSSGGGAGQSVLSRCVVTYNLADSYGGGAAYSTLYDCLVARNLARLSGSGGGTAYSTLYSCTVTANSAAIYGEGSYYDAAYNSVIYPDGVFASTVRYSLTVTLKEGAGNIAGDPRFMDSAAGDWRLMSNSPCINVGTSQEWMTGSLELIGNSRVLNGRVDMGAYEYYRGAPAVGAPLVDVTNADAIVSSEATALTVGGTCNAAIAGDLRWTNSVTGEGGVLRAAPVWSVERVRLGVGWNVVTVEGTNTAGDAVSDHVSILRPYGGITPVHYVATNGAALWPYVDWNTAARTIQDAVDAASAGDFVLVGDGTYAAGLRTRPGEFLMNRVLITNAITIASLNGPAVTRIVGSQPVGVGESAIRCVCLDSHAVLAGFTLWGGATRDWQASSDGEQNGGGAWCAAGCVLSNCWIQGNVAYKSGGGVSGGSAMNSLIVSNSAGSGGGAYQSSLTCCSISNNTASGSGGGAYGGNVRQCVVAANRAKDGGGVYGANLENSFVSRNTASQYGGGVYSLSCVSNCTVAGNAAKYGGGVCFGNIYNSIVYYNTAALAGDNSYFYTSTRFFNSCTVPLPATYGNISDEPGLSSLDNPHVPVDSPCVDRVPVTAARLGVDIDGQTRPYGAAMDMGCDEVTPAALVGPLTVRIVAAYTNVVAGTPLTLQADIAGLVAGYRWEWGDGTAQSNCLFAAHSYSATGVYDVALRAWNQSAENTVWLRVRVVDQALAFVSKLGGHIPPFTSWAMAATNIQAAVDAMQTAGGTVVVTNGIYEAGGRAIYGGLLNRVAIDKPLVVCSVSGPDQTSIMGRSPCGASAIRCAYVGRDAKLVGFTLTNGATRTMNDHNEGQTSIYLETGGGAFCDARGTVSNCIFRSNYANYGGGGAAYGRISRCLFSENRVSSYNYGGGTFWGLVSDCVYSNNYCKEGGGAAFSEVWNSVICDHQEGYIGAGAYGGKLVNCLIWRNTSSYEGGGTYFSDTVNCTIVSNRSAIAGGVYDGRHQNSIVYFNSASSSDFTNANWEISVWNDSVFSMDRCCTVPLPPAGTRNTKSSPMFIDIDRRNCRLSASSPCVDTGVSQAWMFGATDLDGKPRIRNGTVDMGSYEFAFCANLKGLLQGAYKTNAHGMVTSLSTNVPLTSPYAANDRTVTAISSNVVDWALVEVQDTNGVPVASTSAFLDPVGRVLDVEGGTNIPVEASAGSYYLVLKHRNHLSAMSALPVAFTNTVVSYDFTTDPDKYRGGTNACVKLEPGVWGLIGGDADGDGRITPVDRIIVERQKGMTGYLQGDLNLDGKVDGGDE